MRKRYLRFATRIFGWIAPFTRNMSPKKPLEANGLYTNWKFASKARSWMTSGRSKGSSPAGGRSLSGS